MSLTTHKSKFLEGELCIFSMHCFFTHMKNHLFSLAIKNMLVYLPDDSFMVYLGG